MSTQDGWTALHLAALGGKVDVVRLLLTEAQALIDTQTEVHSHHIMTLSTALSSSHVSYSRRAENVNSMYVLFVFQPVVLYHVQRCMWRCKDVLAVFSMRNSCIMIMWC